MKIRRRIVQALRRLQGTAAAANERDLSHDASATRTAYFRQGTRWLESGGSEYSARRIQCPGAFTSGNRHHEVPCAGSTSTRRDFATR